MRSGGPADAALVWQRYVEPKLWSSWAPHIRSVQYSMPRLQANTTGAVCGPLGLRVPFTVDAVDEQSRTWSWTVHLRIRGRNVLTMALAHGVESDGTGCLTWLRLRGRWPVVVGYAPAARFALRRLVR